MSTEPTNEAIRIACAEAMGWKSRKVPSDAEMKDARDGTGAYVGMAGYPIGGGPGGGLQYIWWTNPDGKDSVPPNYPEDDKAARELRESLTEQEMIKFIEVLGEVLAPHDTNYESNYWAVFHLLNASPREQAIAFLKVRGVEL